MIQNASSKLTSCVWCILPLIKGAIPVIFVSCPPTLLEVGCMLLSKSKNQKNQSILIFLISLLSPPPQSRPLNPSLSIPTPPLQPLQLNTPFKPALYPL